MSSDDKSGASPDQRMALQTVSDRLCELAANILRAVRGAGKPYQIGRQAQALVEAMVAYREKAGQFPSDEEVGAALDIGVPGEELDRMSDEQESIVQARQVIIQGAMQIAASRLVSQRTQEAAGISEMDDGIRGLEKVRAERRMRGAAQQPAPTSPQPSKRR